MQRPVQTDVRTHATLFWARNRGSTTSVTNAADQSRRSARRGCPSAWDFTEHRLGEGAPRRHPGGVAGRSLHRKPPNPQSLSSGAGRASGASLLDDDRAGRNADCTRKCLDRARVDPLAHEKFDHADLARECDLRRECGCANTERAARSGTGTTSRGRSAPSAHEILANSDAGENAKPPPRRHGKGFALSAARHSFTPMPRGMGRSK